MGDPNASIPTPQPVHYRPMFGALRPGAGARRASPSSRSAAHRGRRARPAAARQARCCRGREHARRHRQGVDDPQRRARRMIEVDPETYEVRADGELLTCEPAERAADGAALLPVLRSHARCASDRHAARPRCADAASDRVVLDYDGRHRRRDRAHDRDGRASCSTCRARRASARRRRAGARGRRRRAGVAASAEAAARDPRRRSGRRWSASPGISATAICRPQIARGPRCGSAHDHVIAEMLERARRQRARRSTAPFDPEGGAYAARRGSARRTHHGHHDHRRIIDHDRLTRALST